MADQLTPSQQAAAFHGLAMNVAYPSEERWSCALRALALYEAEVERLQELLDDLGYKAGASE